MDWREALEVLGRRGGRFRVWRDRCDESRPNHQAARRTVVHLAGGEPEYPSMAEMVGNAMKAGAAFVASGVVLVGKDERSRRLGICGGCEHFDHARERCRKCGCFVAIKALAESSHCPIGLW